MAKKAAPKITVTKEMKRTQDELKAFLKRNPTIEAKAIYPFGHSVDVSTIPDEVATEFLSIVNKNQSNE